MKTLAYNGLITVSRELIYTNTEAGQHFQGEYDVLRLSTLQEPLAAQVDLDLGKRRLQATARYWISDLQLTKDQLIENTAKQALGIMDADWFSSFSEVTPDLEYEETLKIGGHDLLAELKSYVGKWVYLEIEYEAQE